MKGIRRIIGIAAVLCIVPKVYAQYDYGTEVSDWTLDMGEDVVEKPSHKEYKNILYLQYATSTYHTSESRRLGFNEYSLGWARAIQVVEEKPYYVEVGVDAKFSHSDGNRHYDYSAFNMMTLRLPVNALYKFWLCKEKDIALSPFAGINCRWIALGREKTGNRSVDIFDDNNGNISGWKKIQLGWQAGVKFQFDRMYVGASYSRDFRDKTRDPHIHEIAAHVGVCF